MKYIIPGKLIITPRVVNITTEVTISLSGDCSSALAPSQIMMRLPTIKLFLDIINFIKLSIRILKLLEKTIGK